MYTRARKSRQTSIWTQVGSRPKLISARQGLGFMFWACAQNLGSRFGPGPQRWTQFWAHAQIWPWVKNRTLFPHGQPRGTVGEDTAVDPAPGQGTLAIFHYPGFVGGGPPWPKMVFGHNLHRMAPFGILEAGFCMVFRPASFWFWVPRTNIGARGQNWSKNLILGPFWVPFGPRRPNFQKQKKCT